jgi:hypothetical protein
MVTFRACYLSGHRNLASCETLTLCIVQALEKLGRKRIRLAELIVDPTPGSGFGLARCLLVD